MKLVVTGGAGFIGKNFIRLLASERPEYFVVNFDTLTYAGNLGGLPKESATYRFVHADVRDPEAVAAALNGADAVVHFAAESHVDRSIVNSSPFISTNVLGTQVLLDAAREQKVTTFVQVSTDEVYGTLAVDEPAFTEHTPLAPRSPYAASKAAADLLVQSYHATHGLDTRITRCSNNYGPFQFPEKLLPLTMLNVFFNRPIPIYGDGRQRRDWIHVNDHCRGILAVLESGKSGEVYNIGADQEIDNLKAVNMVLSILGSSTDLITYVKDRPGHDRRYSINAAKIRSELKWSPRYSFEEGLAETIEWYQHNRAWWLPILGEEYVRYYRAQYGNQ